jgi:hypothetical protein
VSWDAVNVDAFMAGFGIAEHVFGVILAFLSGVWLLLKLLRAAGW